MAGKTSGSTLALSGPGATGLSVNSSTGAITGTPTAPGAVNVVETLAGATGSPRTNSGVVSVIAAVIPLRVGSVENRINVATASRGKTNCVVRWPHFLGTDLSDIVLSFNNWFNSGGEVNPGNDVTIIDAAFENESGSIVVPVQFAGSRLRVLADGENDAQADAILPSQFGLSKFSRGELYWFKARYSVPTTAGKIPYSDRSRNNFTGSQVLWYDPAATTVSSTDVAGAYTGTGAAFDVIMSQDVV